MLRRAILAAMIGVSVLVGIQQASADVYVRGYYRSNGTYVSPHYRSDPDSSFGNNWSTYGNVNPYTGRVGTKVAPTYTPRYYSPAYKWSW